MRKILFGVLVTEWLLVLCVGCGGSSSNTSSGTTGPIAKGNRILAIDVNTAEDDKYDEAFQYARSLGVQAVPLSLRWNDLETSPMVFEPYPDLLEFANAYYPSTNVKVALMIAPIDINQKRVPSDLVDKDFDDPVMIDRFKALLDYVFSQIPDLELTSLAIGNEIDLYLGMDEVLWGQYETFFKATSAYAKTKRPGLIVGTKGTFDGLMGNTQDHLNAINQFTDVVMVTYYPLNSDFTVLDPTTVETDFQALSLAYDGRTIFLHECGYPSSSVCNSSQAKQAEFVREVFKSWDVHSSQIELVVFSVLTDLSQSSVEKIIYEYGFLGGNEFKEFLRSLGLRIYLGSGSYKESFDALAEEASARGW